MAEAEDAELALQAELAASAAAEARDLRKDAAVDEEESPKSASELMVEELAAAVAASAAAAAAGAGLLFSFFGTGPQPRPVQPQPQQAPQQVQAASEPQAAPRQLTTQKAEGATSTPALFLSKLLQSAAWDVLQRNPDWAAAFAPLLESAPTPQVLAFCSSCVEVLHRADSYGNAFGKSQRAEASATFRAHARGPAVIATLRDKFEALHGNAPPPRSEVAWFHLWKQAVAIFVRLNGQPLFKVASAPVAPVSATSAEARQRDARRVAAYLAGWVLFKLPSSWRVGATRIKRSFYCCGTRVKCRVICDEFEMKLKGCKHKLTRHAHIHNDRAGCHDVPHNRAHLLPLSNTRETLSRLSASFV